MPKMVFYCRVSTRDQNVNLQRDAAVKMGASREHLCRESERFASVRPQCSAAVSSEPAAADLSLSSLAFAALSWSFRSPIWCCSREVPR
jgi:hypothetical protein